MKNNSSSVDNLIIDTAYVGILKNGDIYKFIINKDSTATYRYNDTNYRYSAINNGFIKKKGNGLYSFLCKKSIGFSICKSYTYGENKLSIFINVDSASDYYNNKIPVKIKYNRNGYIRFEILDRPLTIFKMDSIPNKKINDLIDIEYDLVDFGFKENIKVKVDYIYTGIYIHSSIDNFDFRLTNDYLKIYKYHNDLPEPHNVDSIIIRIKK